MFISSRTRSIIYLLKRTNGTISVKDLANKLNLTERTIYRELTDLTKVLEHYQIRLETVPGKGMRLCGEKEAIDSLDLYLNEYQVDCGFNSPKVRKDMVLIHLLHQNDYIKVQGLASDLRVSIQTIRNDLHHIEEMAANHNVTLKKKKSEGIFLEGNAILKSHYLTSIILENVEVDTFFHWLTHDNHSRHDFILLLEKYHYKGVLRTIYHMAREIIMAEKIQMTDTNLMEFVFLLSRMTLSHAAEKDYDDFNVCIHHNPCNHEVAGKLERSLQQLFQIELSNGERMYLYWLISITFRKESQQSVIDASKITFMQRVRQFIADVEAGTGIEFGSDRSLLEGLAVHIDRSISKVRNGIFAANPMINEIATNYQSLYHVIKTSVKKTFSEAHFPDSEIGYLTLHFIVSMEKHTAKALHVLVVCSSGMGSSKMLASRLEREFPEILIKDVIPLMKLHEEDLGQYDLVVSTIPLYLPEHQYIMVSPLLNVKEVEMLRERIANLKEGKSRGVKREKLAATKRHEDAILTLQQINLVTYWGIKLIENFEVVPITGEKRVIDVIDYIQEHLFQKKVLRSSNDISEFIASRQKNEVLVLPDSRLAYSEFYLNHLDEPLLSVYRLVADHTYTFGPEEAAGIVSMIVMIYPAHSNGLLIDFLSEITMMAIEDVEIVHSFEIENEHALKRILGQRIKQYLVQKL
ncbi:BglG family transcription antiterminator [Brevibacillus sp. B_LB10_24]|uniref:BglG family transcription antiterminator n=1 Tax=Brevibacillus sp. B_LB10_24 TaxID=3380645 RepID=UPI0038BC697D